MRIPTPSPATAVELTLFWLLVLAAALAIVGRP